MADMVRLTSRWDGFPGSPGYTNFYGLLSGMTAQERADAMNATIKTFWLTVNGFLPADVAITIVPTYQVLDAATGQILEEGTVTVANVPIAGTSGANYAGNSGVAVNWSTSDFIAGHRVKGRTYLVPFTGCFELNGTLALAAITAIKDAATILNGDGTVHVVWHRPVNGAGGSAHLITAATVRDRAAILRSRSI
jgi:hypothetical protein